MDRISSSKVYVEQGQIQEFLKGQSSGSPKRQVRRNFKNDNQKGGLSPLPLPWIRHWRNKSCYFKRVNIRFLILLPLTSEPI